MGAQGTSQAPQPSSGFGSSFTALPAASGFGGTNPQSTANAQGAPSTPYVPEPTTPGGTPLSSVRMLQGSAQAPSPFGQPTPPPNTSPQGMPFQPPGAPSPTQQNNFQSPYYMDRWASQIPYYMDRMASRLPPQAQGNAYGLGLGQSMWRPSPYENPPQQPPMNQQGYGQFAFTPPPQPQGLNPVIQQRMEQRQQEEVARRAAAQQATAQQAAAQKAAEQQALMHPGTPGIDNSFAYGSGGW